MRKVFVFLLVCVVTLPSIAKKPGRELSDLLLSYMQLEDVHPDSLEHNIARLKQRRMALQDPSARAVYAAAIAYYYSERQQWQSARYDEWCDSTVLWYGRALADKSLLADTKSKRWKGFVVRGKDETYFRGDMLNVVWRSMTEQVDRAVRDTASVLPKLDEMVYFYQQRGMREAALLLEMNALDWYTATERVNHLQRLRHDYADIELCAEVYLMLANETNWCGEDEDVSQLSQQEVDNRRAHLQREWLQQGLTLYPHYKRKAALKNALTRLSDPFLHWHGPTRVYPGKSYWCKFEARNVRSVLVNGVEHVFPSCDAIDTFTDSLLWTAPEAGNHTLCFEPRVRVKVVEKVKPQYVRVNATALHEVFQLMPDSSFRTLVVDAETGTPVPNVVLTAYEPSDKWTDTIPYFVGLTDERGMVSVPRYKGAHSYRWQNVLRYRLSTPSEQHLAQRRRYFYHSNQWKGVPTTEQQHLQLFTDRSIYRPGQTVHVSGIAYAQLDWDAHVQPERRHKLQLYDSDYKLVAEQQVECDEMGVFLCDFVLPTGRRNGYFHIKVSGRERTSFRVEEYKRPTFEVMLEDSLISHDERIEVRGRATNYDGSPLRGARVTGSFTWNSPWFSYGKRYPKNETHPLDTLETDDDGRFSYWLKNQQTQTSARGEVPIRRWLTVNVDVLSQQGETHHAQRGYWRQTVAVPQPEPQHVDSTFLVRCVVDSFAIGKPGRIEVTTNLHDVCLYYTLAAAGKVWQDEMVKLDHETFVLDIPYRPEYDQSLTASFCFVKGERAYTDSKTIYLALPDSKLRPRWDTFRNLLQPGQHEEWQLTLLRPDGTPAAANLMVAMYDASLDYFSHHAWNFGVNRSHRTFGIPFDAQGLNSDYLIHYLGSYSQKLKKERDLAFTQIRPELFQMGAYSRAAGRGPILYKNMPMLASSTRIEALSVTNGLDMAQAKNATVRVRGITMAEVVPETEADEEATTEEQALPAVKMRDNFDETAFFYPQLRTNSAGQVSIVFNLPESLTRWHFMGVAHTSDMLFANLSEQVEARKDLMAQLHLPRFLRPGDEAELIASVRNVSDQPQRGSGVMQILDAQTEKVLKQWKCNIQLSAQRDTILNFQFSILNFQFSEGLIVRWVVEGTTCSDGEQRFLPILPATQHMTNTLAITAYDPQVQNMNLKDIFPDGVTDRHLTIEYTTHPELYALQTLPSLARTKREDVLSLTSAYYAGVLAKALDEKGVQTINQVTDSTQVYLEKIQRLQDKEGGFRWYPGMPVSSYLTREVAFLLTRLNMLTGQMPAEQVCTKAVHYLLQQRIDSTYLSLADLRMLYIVQFSGVKLSRDEQRKVNFLLKLAKREDVEEDGYERQALLAIVLKEAGANRKAQKCAKAFRKYLVTSADRGTYIEFPKGSLSSIDRKLHIHVQLMEAVQRVMPDSINLWNGMRRYLLQQKRTQEWSTPVNSANAVFALLGHSSSSTSNQQDTRKSLKDLLTLTRKGTSVQNFVPKDDTLGFVRDSIDIEDGKLPVQLRLHKFSKGESWGAVYADFQQRYDQVESRATGLSVKQEFPDRAQAGSRYTVRYRITADRDYEYVTLVCPRPAFTEPVNQRSGYGWSGWTTKGWNGGLGYYRQVHDATTEYSFHQIPRGEYVIEETLYVERGGSYHSGVAVIRCEYAEEFQGHSADCVVKVDGRK